MLSNVPAVGTGRGAGQQRGPARDQHTVDPGRRAGGVVWPAEVGDRRRVEDHQVGQLAGLPVLLALDLWEHAFMVDYVPAEKKHYVDAFLANLNWSVVERRFDDAAK